MGSGSSVLLFTVAAFVALPFSGLDTLPALGVVVIALSLILEDVLITVVGTVIGLAGIALEVALGSAVLHFLSPWSGELGCHRAVDILVDARDPVVDDRHDDAVLHLERLPVRDDRARSPRTA